MLLPAGLEPAIAVPKTAVISISLQEHYTNDTLNYELIKKCNKIDLMKILHTESFAIPEEVSTVSTTLENKGFEAYLIGGCVRDLFLKRKPKDWDFTTNATPEEIMACFENTFYENDYGTVGIVNENAKDETLKVVEVTPYRLETKYSDNRRPDSVTFGANLEEDLKRRDFTINAIALKIEKPAETKNCHKVETTDLFNGHHDLEMGIIRTVGEPLERFSEDALRIIRAIRIASELGFKIEAKTETAIETTKNLLKNIAKERIRDEFLRILMSERPMEGIQLCRKFGILQFIAPELETGIGVTQNKAHSYDVWEHTLRTVQHAAGKNWPPEVRLAALLHDIGKPAVRKWSPEKNDWIFHGHDVVGAKIAAKIMANLKFSKKEIEKITKLVRWHMFFSDTELITLSAVRRIVNKVGSENIQDLMNLRMSDRIGTGRPKESPYRLRKYQSMIEEVMRNPINVGVLKINGHEIMKIANIQPGPKIGCILNALLEEIIEKPELNTETNLQKMAMEMAKLPDEILKRLGEKGKEKKEKEEEKEIQEIRKKYWVK